MKETKATNIHGIEFKIITLNDIPKLKNLFEQVPYLSFNVNNYTEWFNTAGFRLYSLSKENEIISTLGVTRNYTLDYRECNDTIKQIIGSYCLAFWKEQKYKYNPYISELMLDKVTKIEGKLDNMFGIISPILIKKHPEWETELSSLYKCRDWEIIGKSIAHNGPLIRKKCQPQN